MAFTTCQIRTGNGKNDLIWKWRLMANTPSHIVKANTAHAGNLFDRCIASIKTLGNEQDQFAPLINQLLQGVDTGSHDVSEYRSKLSQMEKILTQFLQGKPSDATLYDLKDQLVTTKLAMAVNMGDVDIGSFGEANHVSPPAGLPKPSIAKTIV